MKISALLAAVTIGTVTACAASAPEEGENLGTTAQALCPRGMDCFSEPLEPIIKDPIIKDPIVSPVLDPTPPPPAPTTFQCPTKKVDCNPFLFCTADTSSAVSSGGGGTVCSCEKGCSGGLFQSYSYNPCPSWAPTYTCTTYGSCTCR